MATLPLDCIIHQSRSF